MCTDAYLLIQRRYYEGVELYQPINSVDTTTFDWMCRVRVQSFWKGLNRESQEFWGVNMVLIDDSVCLSEPLFI